MENELEIPELDFEAQEGEQAPEAQPQAQAQEPQPAPAPAPAPQPPVGPAVRQAQQELAAIEAQIKQYSDLVKKLEESGFDAAEYRAKLQELTVQKVVAERELRTAKRQDAMLYAGQVEQEALKMLKGRVPEHVIQAVQPVIRNQIQQLLATNPDLLYDPKVVEGLVKLAFGEAVLSGRARSAGRQAPSQGTPVPPPSPRKEPPPIPEEVARLGIREATWREVEKYSTEDLASGVPLDL